MNSSSLAKIALEKYKNDKSTNRIGLYECIYCKYAADKLGKKKLSTFNSVN